MLAGLTFFEKAITYIRQYQKPGQKVHHAIQTNATLMTREFAEFFRDHEFDVGVSIDGPAEIHNHHRRFCGGQDSFEKVMTGVKLLREAGINPAITCTVTRKTVTHPIEVFRFLVKSGFQQLKYSPVFEPDHDRFGIDASQWYDYLKQVFDTWFELGDPEVKVRDLDEVIAWLTKDRITLCSVDRTCLNWVSVDPKGELYPCEYLRAAHGYGNIGSIELASIVATPTYQDFCHAFLAIPPDCQVCEFFPLCGNGCPATRLRDGKLDPTGVYVYCQERKDLYGHIKRTFEETLGTTISDCTDIKEKGGDEE